ncbi:hypothetical protein KIW84_058135 [Lathyrus oleraceus]|uniref:Uncharacterized protein n=1 Tax=Pisum sativum TaxID=3888 RepID=A0A9D4X355_PEA|nr:hypothetical protein KIW84_058135 [Pisum sativum]
MRTTLNPVYRGSLPPFLVVDIEEHQGFVQEDLEQEKVVMADNDIIGIANDRARNIKDYVMFDSNVMNTRIIRPEIIVAQFIFNPMMFQMLQAIGQYSGSANDDPHRHLRQFLEVANTPTPSQKKPARVHEVTETTIFAAQIAQLNQMMKNVMNSHVMPIDEPVKVVNDTSEVACFYCGGARLFEDCFANPVSVNYVGNKKYNNP